MLWPLGEGNEHDRSVIAVLQPSPLPLPVLVAELAPAVVRGKQERAAGWRRRWRLGEESEGERPASYVPDALIFVVVALQQGCSCKLMSHTASCGCEAWNIKIFSRVRFFGLTHLANPLTWASLEGAGTVGGHIRPFIVVPPGKGFFSSLVPSFRRLQG